MLEMRFGSHFRWLLFAPLLVACGGAGTGDTGGQGSAVGAAFEGGECGDAMSWGGECRVEGGSYDYCNSAACTGAPQTGTICHPPPPAPAADEFGCAWLNCKKGQICV